MTAYDTDSLREAVTENITEDPSRVDPDLVRWAVESYLDDWGEEELVDKANELGLDVSEYEQETS